MKIVKVFGIAVFLLMSVYAAKKVYVHVIDQEICNQCGDCVKGCPEEAIKVITKDGKMIHEIDLDLCTQCGICIDNCPLEAIETVEQKDTPKKKK